MIIKQKILISTFLNKWCEKSDQITRKNSSNKNLYCFIFFHLHLLMKNRKWVSEIRLLNITFSLDESNGTSIDYHSPSLQIIERHCIYALSLFSFEMNIYDK